MNRIAKRLITMDNKYPSNVDFNLNLNLKCIDTIRQRLRGQDTSDDDSEVSNMSSTMSKINQLLHDFKLFMKHHIGRDCPLYSPKTLQKEILTLCEIIETIDVNDSTTHEVLSNMFKVWTGGLSWKYLSNNITKHVQQIKNNDF